MSVIMHIGAVDPWLAHSGSERSRSGLRLYKICGSFSQDLSGSLICISGPKGPAV